MTIDLKSIAYDSDLSIDLFGNISRTMKPMHDLKGKNRDNLLKLMGGNHHRNVKLDDKRGIESSQSSWRSR